MSLKPRLCVVFSSRVTGTQRLTLRSTLYDRPRLGTPDAAAELAKLQAAEEQRAQEVQTAITSFRKSILASEALAAKQFVARLAAAVKALALLLDSLPASEDIGQCEVRHG